MATPETDLASQNPSRDELDAFTRVAAILQTLEDDARHRVFRTLATFFGESPGSPPSSSKVSSDVARQTSISSFSEDRSLSPKEFLLEKRPHTDVERIACLAYYLTHYRATPEFKTLELSKLNTEAAQVKFANTANAADNASKAGLLVPTTRGQKQISAMGELYVQALPDRAAAKDAIAHGRPRRSRTKNKSARSSDVADPN